MLIEEILLSITDSQLIMANTDGFEVLIPRKHEELYYDLCKKMGDNY